MNSHLTLPALSLAALLTLVACGTEDDQDPSSPAADWRDPPLGMELARDQFLVPDDNPMTDAKVELGKQLFFDPRLSMDGSTSCSTCHQHERGWSNGERFAAMVGGGKTARNVPSLYNLAYHDRLFWDGRAASIEAAVAEVWKLYMNGGADTADRAEALGAIDGYRRQFRDVFGAQPTSENVVQALSTFVRTLRAGDSLWDRYVEADDVALVTPAVIAGHGLYIGKAGCGACHMPPLYTDLNFHPLGVGESDDPGRGAYEPDVRLAQGAFKNPTMRSISKSAPYFHDGSVADLREAVRLMVTGGGDHPKYPPNDELMRDRKLSAKDIDKIVAFLTALDSGESFVVPTLPD